jgi:hypothetical protein
MMSFFTPYKHKESRNVTWLHCISEIAKQKTVRQLDPGFIQVLNQLVNLIEYTVAMTPPHTVCYSIV